MSRLAVESLEWITTGPPHWYAPKTEAYMPDRSRDVVGYSQTHRIQQDW